ncbi:hypothetical protein TNCV_3994251 [Trichonephila clavipes]|uniref:Uncharacterized protein n=1 Tax=Trichonephila clavipes TaxID=2585209 RepID=A0A8X6T6G9_TRICX|nr:hypothetical protein TNCV_3994251 [Trichonephila clavipes]
MTPELAPILQNFTPGLREDFELRNIEWASAALHFCGIRTRNEILCGQGSLEITYNQRCRVTGLSPHTTENPPCRRADERDKFVAALNPHVGVLWKLGEGGFGSGAILVV